jgi:diaminobutyrate-2-oxoglutarate transaminase
MKIIERYESRVRSYSRSFPVVFSKAKGSTLIDAEDREYLDFFAGAGALNYGHNNPALMQPLLAYIEAENITHSLDMATEARERFLEILHDIILEPRGLDYKVLFPGPTGTNCVEAALKLSRKVTGRSTVVSFTNGFHGMTLGALAVTGNAVKRRGAGKNLDDVVFMPYDGFMGANHDTLDLLGRMLSDGGSGLDTPAAAIVETVQGEGGLNVAGVEWLRRLAGICREHDIRLIVDDIQSGCGRTGTFFSFEQVGIIPDFICLSKAIGGYGLPMSILLVKPEYDQFAPGEHNGTFRGNNLAFVTAAAALEAYWRDGRLAASVRRKEQIIQARLRRITKTMPNLNPEIRGRGLMQGLALRPDGAAEAVCARAFGLGLVMETAGPRNEVAKIMPPLTIGDAELEKGLSIFEAAILAVADEHQETISDVA